MQSKLSFLISVREWGIVGLILLCILALSVGYRWVAFQDYIQQDRQKIQAVVLNQYLKNDKWVLKLKSDNGFILYTTSKEKLKNLKNRQIFIFGKPAKCSFIQSLQSCFLITFSFEVRPKTWRNVFYDFIASQHRDDLSARLYQSLFFATTLPKEWRDFASDFKIAHLLAISGLHLAILSCVFLAVISPIYRFFQAKFFTYRNQAFDLGFALLVFLFGYLIILDFPPSFVRAYVMSVLAFVLFYAYMLLLNFMFLLFCGIVVLCIFPQFIFSLGFYFSMLGVFYIFLFLKYVRFERIKNPILKGLFIACGINVVLFFNLLPLTHLFFPTFSLLSIMAIPLSLVFTPFFALVLLLHCIGLGGVFDEYLLQSLKWQTSSIEFKTPLWFGVCYLILSVLAMRNARYYGIFLCLGVGFYLFLMLKFL